MGTITQEQGTSGVGGPNAPSGDPKERGPQPPFKQQEGQETVEYPGTEADLTPKADHGEQSYKGSGRLAGKKALITGGDSGIGRAVAIAFAREGADIAISYTEAEEQDARETERWVTEAGRKCVLLPGDIKDEGHCTELIENATRELGGLNILINNAAYQRTWQDITEIPTEEFDAIFKTNIYAPFWLTRAALKVFPEGGSIINTVSIQAYQPSANLLPYSATKGALVNLTKAVAQAAAEKGIRCNAVAPGPVWTPLIPYSMPKEKVQEFGKDTYLKRPAQPAELAPVYVLLASDESSYVTGAIYPVTGGEVIA
jgi:NAD(P)-dependent dehydrogenase (short-subunit alcohol dehydrogenase family)